ncbi:MAG: hypothetical protein H6744_11175 [Deltaproteobacteria bacterium]|nr:hypothetical protein [Deltaproteobacteria bacterium]MCB9787242.1 hypothetical protein [Deltaproteobacteria bacterium]
MPTFEVTVPPEEGGGTSIRMTVEAEHWMDAWRCALDELDEAVPPPHEVTCRIGHDGSVEVIAPAPGRRLFIQSTPRRDLRESPSGNPGVPVDAQPVAPAAPAERPRIRRVGHAKKPDSGTAHAVAPDLVVPAAAPLTGGPVTSAEDALEMLERHVRCEEIQLWIPAPSRHGWRLHTSRGLDPRFVPGVLLRESELFPGAAAGGPGRRTFVGAGASVRCTRGLGRKFVVAVKSAVWAPVTVAGEAIALILLLNARRSGGFTDPELSAVDELSRILAARLERAGLSGFD